MARVQAFSSRLDASKSQSDDIQDIQQRICLHRTLDLNAFDPQAMPPWLGNLTNLQTLCVDNTMTISIVLVVLVRRARSHARRTCNGCNLNGAIPNSLNKLTKLTILCVWARVPSIATMTPNISATVPSLPRHCLSFRQEFLRQQSRRQNPSVGGQLHQVKDPVSMRETSTR